MTRLPSVVYLAPLDPMFMAVVCSDMGWTVISRNYLAGLTHATNTPNMDNSAQSQQPIPPSA